MAKVSAASTGPSGGAAPAACTVSGSACARWMARSTKWQPSPTRRPPPASRARRPRAGGAEAAAAFSRVLQPGAVRERAGVDADRDRVAAARAECLVELVDGRRVAAVEA